MDPSRIFLAYLDLYKKDEILNFNQKINIFFDILSPCGFCTEAV